MRRALPLAMACALWASARPAHGSAPELFGLGPRAVALAGAGVADGDGWDQAYTNPAGLIDARRRRLSVGYLGARYRLELDGARRAATPTDGVLLGAVLPVPFGGVLRDRVALGLGFYFPTAFITRARAPYPETPRLPLLDDRTQVVSVIVSAAARVHARVDVGIGVLALAALVGRIVVATDSGGNATTLSNQELVTRLAPLVGLRVRATDRLRLGLVYRGESKAEYDVTIATDLGARLPLPIPALLLRGVAQYDPHQLHLEGAVRLGPATLLVGLGWKHWSGYPIPSENATKGTPAQPSPGFHDTVVPRLAAEASHALPHGLVVIGRVGYAYELSPADAATASSYVDADRHLLGVGAGLGWTRGRAGLHLDLGGQWQHLSRATRAMGDLGVFTATLGIDL
jgi:long-subunit fatty acid transport protein